MTRTVIFLKSFLLFFFLVFFVNNLFDYLDVLDGISIYSLLLEDLLVVLLPLLHLIFLILL